MATLDLDGVVLGSSGQRPAVIIPLTAPDTERLAGQARAATGTADLVEWRVDAFAESLGSESLARTAGLIREAAGRPLIATLRTAAEGGAFSDDEAYFQLVGRLMVLDAVSLVDVESARTAAGRCLARAGELGMPVIASHHDVTGTPSVDRMVGLLAAMEAGGAQVCKLAVMAHSSADTARLLLATATRQQDAGVPLLTMAMGPAGLASRLVGHLFGSCATFAANDGIGSAPGQPSVDALRAVLAQLAQLDERSHSVEARA